MTYILTTRATEEHESVETVLDAETATEAATEAAGLCKEYGWPGGVVWDGDLEVATIDRAGEWRSV